METPRYYNVYIKYHQEQGLTFSEKYVRLVAYKREEIKKYFRYIEEGESGLQPISSEQVNVVEPNLFRIFNTSKLSSGKKKAFYEERVKSKIREREDTLAAFGELGLDVTENFGIKLEEVLEKRKRNIVLKRQELFPNLPVDSEIGQNTPSSSSVPESNAKKSSEEKKKPITRSGFSTIKGGGYIGNTKPNKIKSIMPVLFNEGITNKSIEPAFGVKKTAEVFAKHIIKLKKEDGQMVGVFGKWGRGKTYFINQVFDVLNSQEDKYFSQVNFQAWRYQHTPSIWAYLYETIFKEYLNVQWHIRLYRIFKLNENRLGKWKSWVFPLLTMLIGIIWILVFNFNDKFNSLHYLVKWSGGIVSFLIIALKSVSFYFFSKSPALKIFNTITKIPSFNIVLGAQAEIQKELVCLIQTWTKIIGEKRILLFIDDLDRCSESQLMEIIDSLRVMLDDEEINKHLLVLVALDELKLGNAISEKYSHIPKEEKSGLSDEYFDKLFISAIKLFPINNDERSEFLQKLANKVNNRERSTAEVEVSVEPLTTEPQSDDGETTEKPTVDSSPASSSPVKKSDDNLDDIEIELLKDKIQLSPKELTPRQIRILVYRYLLARNLWLVYYGELEWKVDNAIDEIMKYSNISNKNSADTEVYNGLSKIARMVVAY